MNQKTNTGVVTATLKFLKKLENNELILTQEHTEYFRIIEE